MPLSFRALCSDFYINQRLSLKMDLPMRRDTVLTLFDRVRKQHPWMDRFRRYKNELALESTPRGGTGAQHWLALRKSSVRSGSVNPETDDEAFGLHKLVLELAPYFLDISPLDIDFIELLYGFDLSSGGNHDGAVYRALLADSPLGHLADLAGATVIDCAPIVGIILDEPAGFQAHFEVKTRSPGRGAEGAEAPLSIYLTVRRNGPIGDLKDIPAFTQSLIEKGEELISSRVVPHLLVPIREALSMGNG
jgi:hypothetical protein